VKRGTLAIVLLLALGLILSLGFTSWADPFGMSGPRGHHWGHCGHHGKFAKLTPEEAGKLFDLRQKYLDDTASLRKDMVVKRAELRALWRAENPEEKQILAKLKEINAVKAKLQEKAVPAMIEVKKILPKHEHKKQLGMEDSDTDEETNMAMEFGIPGDVGL